VTEVVTDHADRSVKSDATNWLSPVQSTKAPPAANPKRGTPAQAATRAPRAARSAPPIKNAPPLSASATRLVVIAEPTPIRLPAEAERAVFYAPLITRTADEDVYQSGDPGVVPAVLVHPKLPDNPPYAVPPNRVGMLDLVVSIGGQVERVRLRATTAERRYRDYMMLAAAKAWLFEPARKDGTPVRYRIEIPLTHFVP
ncbi:MAG: hypothetical protein ACRD15_06440, partial [Vicinamibacterales bacterium]